MGSALLPLLRSNAQGDALALVLMSPGDEFTITDLARQIDRSFQTAQAEVSRLVASGIFRDRKQGNMRLISANPDNPLYQPLSALMEATHGPLPVLRGLLTDVDGITWAAIYGSWAARHEGVPGPPPADIDVLLVGTSDLDTLDRIAEQASTRLHRPVNIRRLLPGDWQQLRDTDPFLRTVRAQPLVTITGSEQTEW